MIRLHYRTDLPMIASALREEETGNILLVVNPQVQKLLTYPEREGLYNAMLAELEREYGTVINLNDRRLLRSLTHLLAAGADTLRIAHGMGSYTP